MDLTEETKEAINAVFGDRSVSQFETKERLNELKEYIDDMLNTLPD
jgi:flagellar basal body-associated protein FliL